MTRKKSEAAATALGETTTMLGETLRMLSFKRAPPLMRGSLWLYLDKPFGILVAKKYLGTAEMELVGKSRRYGPPIKTSMTCVEAGGYDIGGWLVNGMTCVPHSILFGLVPNGGLERYQPYYRIQDDSRSLRLVPPLKPRA